MSKKLDTLYRSTPYKVDWDDLPRNELGNYLENAERVARKVILAAGLDADELQSVTGDDLLPEVNRARQILFSVNSLRYQLEKGDPEGTALEAIRLAQHAERFNVDRAYLFPVDVGARVIDGNPNRKPDLTTEVEQYRRDNNCSLTSAREAIAAKHDTSVRTLIRQSKRKHR